MYLLLFLLPNCNQIKRNVKIQNESWACRARPHNTEVKVEVVISVLQSYITLSSSNY